MAAPVGVDTLRHGDARQAAPAAPTAAIRPHLGTFLAQAAEADPFPRSPNERVKVGAVRRFYDLLTGTLKELAGWRRAISGSPKIRRDSGIFPIQACPWKRPNGVSRWGVSISTWSMVAAGLEPRATEPQNP